MMDQLKQELVNWAKDVYLDGYERGREEAEIFELESDLMCEVAEILEKYGLEEEGSDSDT